MNAFTPLSQQASVLALRHHMEELRDTMVGMPQAEFDSIVCHGGGMFARTVKLKAGSVLAGKIHKAEHLNIMSSGDITVVTENGQERLTGFHIMACAPGSRRVGCVHADTIWTTIIKTDETDLGKVEAMFFAKAHSELENTLWPSLTPS